eukprot:Skav206095  [mRNA]  locus=scaffold2150:239336:242452:- [translate_table: standard]
MLSRTVPLSKKQVCRSPADSRPITIISSIYRLWSRVTCSALVRHFHEDIPKQVTGLLPGRGAFAAIFNQQWAVEKAKSSHQCLQGITLDLTKCFNAINRSRLLTVLQLMGLPHSILHVWYLTLQSLTRYWDLSGFASEPCASTTGCPEGDAFSVISMVAICTGWVSGLLDLAPGIQASSYADNWSWWGGSLVHRAAAEWTVRYCDWLGLSIDWSKTWLWSTQGTGLEPLRDALHRVTGRSEFSVRARAQDLGCSVTYHTHASTGVIKDRLSAAKGRLLRLQKTKWDLRTKIHMLRSSIYPAAFYGCELLVVPQTELVSFRTQVANAILGSPNHSASSAILLHVVDAGIVDPHLHVILCAVKAAKVFLHACDPSDKERFLYIVSRPSEQFHVHGPASSLREYLLRLGIACDRSGNLVVDNVITLNLVDTPFATLRTFLMAEWQQHFLILHNDRKDVGRFAPIDRNAVLSLWPKFSSSDRLLLLREISGSFQTRWQSQWDSTTSDSCVFCGGQDTRKHRLLECSHFSHLREPYQNLLDDIGDNHEYLCELPVPRLTQTDYFLRGLHYSMPTPELPTAMVAKIQELYAAATPAFYTDGSALLPECPSVRMASFGVIADLAVTDEMRVQQAKTFRRLDLSPPTLVQLVVGRLHGPQMIHRAELQAIIWVFQHFPRAVVVTDSSFADDWVKKLQQGHSLFDMALHPDIDLLTSLRQTLKPGHSTRKTKAHRDLGSLSDDLDLYDALGNDKADKAAGTANRHLFPPIATQMLAAQQDFQQQQTDFHQFWKYLLKLHTTRALLDTEETIHDVHVPAPQDLLAQARQWAPVNGWRMSSDLTETWLESSAWGLHCMHTVKTFLQGCVWATEQDEGPLADMGVSWAELALGLVLVHGTWLPVRRKDAAGVEYLHQPQSSQEAQSMGVTLGEQSRVAQQLVSQFQSLIPQPVAPDLQGGKVRALTLYGSALHMAGLRRRPSYPQQAEVQSLLQAQLPTGSANLRFLVDLPSHLNFEIWHEDRMVFTQPWKDRLYATHRAQILVRRTRQD